MNRTRATFVGLCASLVMLFSTASPTAADEEDWWLNNSAIDDDGDGRYDLTICFGTVGQPLYENRGLIASFLYGQVSRYVVGDTSVGGVPYDRGFKSNGACDNDGSEVQVVMRNLTSVGCSPFVAQTFDVFGNTPPRSTGHNVLIIALNSRCPWDWNGPIGDVDAWSANSVVLHEFGHVWGLGHDNTPVDALMDEGGPNNCELFGNQQTFHSDDVFHLRGKYGGIANTGNAVAFGCIH